MFISLSVCKGMHWGYNYWLLVRRTEIQMIHPGFKMLESPQQGGNLLFELPYSLCNGAPDA